MHYRLRYLRDGYRLADAFHCDPHWGAQLFNVNADNLPPHTDADIIQSAREAAPAGFWLQRITAYGGEPHEREVFVKPVTDHMREWREKEPSK